MELGKRRTKTPNPLALQLKLVMVWAAPGFNGLILLSELIWFSVKWAEVSIGLVWFGFSFTMGLVWYGLRFCFPVYLLPPRDRSGQLVQLDRPAARTAKHEH